MKANKTKGHRVNLRVSETEWQHIKAEMQRTTARSLSEFVRNKTLAAPLIYTYRSTSLDDCIEELAQLKEELKTVAYHFEIGLQKLNAIPGTHSSAHWIISFEIDRRRVLKQIDKISEYLHKLASHDFEHNNK